MTAFSSSKHPPLRRFFKSFIHSTETTHFPTRKGNKRGERHFSTRRKLKTTRLDSTRRRRIRFPRIFAMRLYDAVYMYICIYNADGLRHPATRDFSPPAKRSPRGNRDSECCRERTESKITNASASRLLIALEGEANISLQNSLSVSLSLCVFSFGTIKSGPRSNRNWNTEKEEGGRRESRFDRSVDG